MARAFALALALALALLAGCTGQADEPVVEALDVIDLGPSPEELARTPGVVRGVVTSVSLAPVAGATLTIERLGLNATTDAAGVYGFPAIPAGAHDFVVEAQGFVTRTVRLAVANGTRLQMDITLTPAVSREPRHEVRELRGFLACGLVAHAPTGEQRHDCAAADENHRDAFELLVDDDAQGAVFELVWDASANPTAKTLRLIVETVGYGALDMELGNATGEGKIAVSVPVEPMLKYYPEGGMMRARILLEGEPASAALQQTFVVYATAFYHGPAPEGYTALKG